MLRMIQAVGNQAQHSASVVAGQRAAQAEVRRVGIRQAGRSLSHFMKHRGIDHLLLKKRSPMQTRFSGLARDAQYIAEQIEARGASRTSTANPEAAESMLS